jgi:hypothetical protein
MGQLIQTWLAHTLFEAQHSSTVIGQNAIAHMKRGVALTIQIERTTSGART